MKIDVIMLISGLCEERLENRENLLRSYACKGTDVRLVLTKDAPASVECLAEMELAAPGILERTVQSEKEGADAIIIWGGHDPSVFSARELVNIPVIGPGMASMHLANLLSERFSLIVQLSNVIDLTWRQVSNLGLDDKCIGIYPVELPVLELGKPESYDKVKMTVLESIDEGAESVCFGCMALNDHVDTLTRDFEVSQPGILVVHPGRAVISMAEMLVRLGLSHSKLSYPAPPKKVISL